ncbi:MAG: cryptochrome/photolyase family protein [Synechococcales cyanobacterium T60_A2020_003]|nr:cryptochrome/photolyase family protein [Synechococcales cyanobacterium T60_A2020_003]
MTVGVWVLGDQLWAGQSALKSCDDQYPVLLIESLDYARQRRYHAQKLVLVWSAMRHFADELRTEGWPVTYAVEDDFLTPLRAWIQAEGITELRVMEPSDRPFQTMLEALDLPCTLTILPNNHFLWSRDEFRQWAGDRKRLLMESFYREGRKRFQILMEGQDPIGGQWNLDKENRKPPKGTLNTPKPQWFEPDEMTQSVIERVKTAVNTYGQIEPFHWAVTRTQALQVLDTFIQTRLETFGPYQDAMVTGEDTMWHALVSPYLNLGLLHPMEVLDAVEQAFHDQDFPLNSVEGFIRQVLGWREYMHGLYHYTDADYPQRNWFEHQHPLPEFFWDASQTDMNCLHQTLAQVERTGYAHHIQRLMVLANFALIAGLKPQEVESWFHAAFIDAHDWVMQPNVIGMGLFADGGMLASKPYAASANYINKMSDYCKGCAYDKGDRAGEHACPFNTFYWDFLDRHRGRLQSQGRMSFILKNLDKMPDSERNAIRQRATEWHQRNA